MSKQHGQALECPSTGDNLVAGLDAAKHCLPVSPAACSEVFRPTAVVRQCSTLVSMRQDLSRLVSTWILDSWAHVTLMMYSPWQAVGGKGQIKGLPEAWPTRLRYTC